MALLGAQGKITFLRVHDVGTGWGPPNDALDVEVIAMLDSQPGKAFGFQLRSDGNQIARQGMLNLLRDAFEHGWKTALDFEIPDGKMNGRIIRVALLK
jgi:hypothetical protein